MKIDELRGKSKDELVGILFDLKKEQMNLRFQRTTGELSNTSRVRTVRKTVARINTLLAQPEIASQKVTAKSKKDAKPATSEKKKVKAEKSSGKEASDVKPAAKKKAAK